MKLEALHEMDPGQEIEIEGVGRMSLGFAKQNIRQKLADMLRTVERTDDPGAWMSLRSKMNNEAMHAIMSAIMKVEGEGQPQGQEI